MSHIERRLSHGGTVRGIPQLVAQAVQIDEQMVGEKLDAIKKLREQGVKAAHPDDGWVNREKNTVRLEYPIFNDNPQVGDLIALGWPWRGYRLVLVTELNFLSTMNPLVLSAYSLRPDEPWSYSFEELNLGEEMNDAHRIEDAGGIVNIGEECFGLADGSVLNWRGQNYTPQKPSLKVRLHNWWVQRKGRGAHERVG